MRVLAVVHQFPPRYEGGTEILCLRSMQALAERGHAVTVIAADPDRRIGRPIVRERTEGIPVWRVPSRARPSISTQARIASDFRRPWLASAVDRLAREFAPDIVHIHHLKTLGFEALTTLAKVAPTIATATDFYLACPFVNALRPDGSLCRDPGSDLAVCLDHFLSTNRLAPLKRIFDVRPKSLEMLEKRQHAFLDGLSALSGLILGTDELARAFVQLGAPIAKIRRIDHFAPPLTVPSRPIGRPPHIAFFGAFNPHKGAHLLVEALNLLPAELDYEARLVGDLSANPRYVAAIRRSAQANRRIRFEESTPNSQFGEAMSEADIVVVPSIWSENRPLVLLAAIEARRFVVVSNVDGLTSALSAPDQGAVFAVGAATALAAVLLDLIRNPAPLERLRSLPPAPSSFHLYIDALLAEYRAAIGERRHSAAKMTA